MSRFLLHLQSASLRAVGSMSPSQGVSTGPENSESLIFERVVGSLGASITSDGYFRQEEEMIEGVEISEERFA